MESCLFTYDGSNGLSVTISDAQVGHEYWFGAANGQDFGTAVSSTLVIPITIVSGTITATSWFAAVGDNTSAVNMVGCTVFSAGETEEVVFDATWDYDTISDDVSVTFQSLLGVDYALWVGDWGAGYAEELATGDGNEMTITVSLVGSGMAGDFTGNLTTPIVGVDTTYSDRLFLFGSQGAGFPGNPSSDPVIATAPTAVETTSATFEGTANPEGVSSTVLFEYGFTTSYGSTTPSQSIGSGSSPVAVEQLVTGLRPGRTYHYRLVRTP